MKITSLFTSSCIISQTKLRSAMEGCKLPSKNRPFPLSQKDSIFAREADRIISASAAAFGFKGRPSAGASALLRTSGAVNIKQL